VILFRKTKGFVYFPLAVLLCICSIAFCEDGGGAMKGENPEKDAYCPEGMVEIPARYMLYFPVFYMVDWEEIAMSSFCIDRYEYPNKRGEFPRVDVTFEEAEALCKEQGKRLCSRLEWLSACMGSENYKYPYGLIYDPEKCNTREGNIFLGSKRSLARSGDFPECRSDFSVYDMTGNAWEWSKNTEALEKRYETVKELRGGGWDTGFACMDKWLQFKKMNLPENFNDETPEIKNRVGFRCCKSLEK